MFCSTIIPTVGRPSLTRAVQSVLQQKTAGFDFEIIVVNDGKRPLPLADWHKSPRVKIVQTQQRERGMARNVGAAIAQGEYFHFLDDDDWLAPGGLAVLHRQTQRQPKAVLVYGGVQLVNRQGTPLIQLKPAFQGNILVQTLAGEWLPLQASLIHTNAFWEIGGFNPVVPGIEDIDLARRLTLHGDVASTPTVVVFVEIGEEGSTTDRTGAHILGQAAREYVFEDTRTWQRLWSSADNAYWRGRIMRAYLTSVVWNSRQRRYTTVFSRITRATLSLLRSGGDMFHKEYWRAVSQPHQGKAFARGIEETTV